MERARNGHSVIKVRTLRILQLYKGSSLISIAKQSSVRERSPAEMSFSARYEFPNGAAPGRSRESRFASFRDDDGAELGRLEPPRRKRIAVLEGSLEDENSASRPGTSRIHLSPE